MPQASDALPNLAGQAVLIAEPNSLIAMDLSGQLREWGARPTPYYDLPGPEQTSALDAIGAALVDVPSDHEALSGLIAALRQRGVPTVLTTACGADNIEAQFPGLMVFDKPVDYTALAQWFCASVPAVGSAGQTG